MPQEYSNSTAAGYRDPVRKQRQKGPDVAAAVLLNHRWLVMSRTGNTRVLLICKLLDCNLNQCCSLFNSCASCAHGVCIGRAKVHSHLVY